MKKYRGRKSFDTAPLSIIQNSSPPQILFCLFFISQFKSKCLQTFYLTTSPFVLIFVKLCIYKKIKKNHRVEKQTKFLCNSCFPTPKKYSIKKNSLRAWGRNNNLINNVISWSNAAARTEKKKQTEQNTKVVIAVCGTYLNDAQPSVSSSFHPFLQIILVLNL